MTDIGKLGNISVNLVGGGEPMMTNEEILKAAQRDQSEIGEAEKEVIKKSFRYAIALATCICVVMILFELIITKNISEKMMI